MSTNYVQNKQHKTIFLSGYALEVQGSSSGNTFEIKTISIGTSLGHLNMNEKLRFPFTLRVVYKIS